MQDNYLRLSYSARIYDIAMVSFQGQRITGLESLSKRYSMWHERKGVYVGWTTQTDLFGHSCRVESRLPHVNTIYIAASDRFPPENQLLCDALAYSYRGTAVDV